jgi:hypothetical protein
VPKLRAKAPTLFIARYFESIAWIAVLASGPPVGPPPFALGPPGLRRGTLFFR